MSELILCPTSGVALLCALHLVRLAHSPIERVDAILPNLLASCPALGLSGFRSEAVAFSVAFLSEVHALVPGERVDAIT